MIDFDHGVDPDWQARVLRWMCSTCLHDPEPEARFEAWVDEAADGDDSYLVWALRAWKKLSRMPAFELEQLAYQTNLWQAHRCFGSSAQPAP